MMEEDIDMKVLVVTTQNAINYGAVLQSYAFHKFLSECEVENYFLNLSRLSSAYFQRLKLDATLPGQLFDLWWRVIWLPQIRRKVKKFEKFSTDNIKLSRLYDNAQAVINDPPEADLLITGGDQMFNASTGIRPIHFLNFGPQNVKRVSYATSMGVNEIPRKYLDEFRELLSCYSALSLREECAADYIEKICNVPCRTNIDPVFLFSQERWNQLIGDYSIKQPKKYILVYSLLYDAGLNAIIKQMASFVRLPVIIISNYARNFTRGGKVIRDAGPIDFLRFFRDAEYIITNSFHGTCFSVIFEKKFFSLTKEHEDMRIISLLRKFGLQDRIIRDPSEVSTQEICFDKSRKIISAERDRAREYIREIIHE